MKNYAFTKLYIDKNINIGKKRKNINIEIHLKYLYNITKSYYLIYYY